MALGQATSLQSATWLDIPSLLLSLSFLYYQAYSYTQLLFFFFFFFFFSQTRGVFDNALCNSFIYLILAGSKPMFLALAGRFFITEPPGTPQLSFWGEKTGAHTYKIYGNLHLTVSMTLSLIKVKSCLDFPDCKAWGRIRSHIRFS